MKMKKIYIFIGLILLLVVILIAIQTQKGKSITFSIFQDSKDNPKGSISVEEFNIPLDREEICTLAKKACNSPTCENIQSPNELSKEILEVFTASFGEFNWIVGLEPVCGPTTAFINEDKKSVVCFCAYE